MPSAAGQREETWADVMREMDDSLRRHRESLTESSWAKDTHSAGISESDRRYGLKKEARAITIWNMRIDQHVAPFLKEFLKDEEERASFEALRIKHLILERKTRAVAAESLWGRALDAAENTVSENKKAMRADRKLIGQIVTKTVKQVRESAKTETDAARKKELLDRAKQASKWMRLKVDENKPLPAAPGAGKAGSRVTAGKADFASVSSRATNTGSAASSRGISQFRLQSFEKEYAEFFAKYPLSKEQKGLIARAIFDYRDYRVVVLDSSGNQAQKAANPDLKSYREMSEARARQFEETLRKPLGDEVFEALLFYRDTRSQRQLADLIGAQMKASGCELSPDTRDKLVRVFKDNRTPFLSTRSSMDARERQDQARRFAEKEGAVMREAASILSARQMEVLQRAWEKLSAGGKKAGGETDGEEG